MPIDLDCADKTVWLKNVQPCRDGTCNPGFIKLAHNQQWDQVYTEIDTAKAGADDYEGASSCTLMVCHTYARVSIRHICPFGASATSDNRASHVRSKSFWCLVINPFVFPSS